MMEPKSYPGLRLPETLYLEATNRCNLKCKGCIIYRGGWEPDRDVSLKEMIMITDQLPELKRVFLHGIGEPLLNEELPRIIRHLKGRAVYVLFNSNGVLLKARKQHDLIQAGLDELRISLDAASPKGYEKIRGSDKFEQVVDNLKAFISLKDEKRADYPRLSLWFLGTRENISELPGFVRLAHDIGIRDVYLQRLVYFQDDDGFGVARADKTLHDSSAEPYGLIRESQDLAAGLGIRFNASGLSEPVESIKPTSGTTSPWRKCYRPSTLMYITAAGNVLPCCISPFSSVDYASTILGNVFEQPLEKIWSGPAYRRFREKQQSDRPPKCCRGCGVNWSL